MIDKGHRAPHIRHHKTTRSLMADVFVTALFLYVMAYFYYGMRSVTLALTGIVSAVVFDVLCTLIAKKRPNLRDWSALVTGIIIPLFLPASIDYHIIVIAAFFAIVVAKHPFGGVGHNVFNPAAAGIAFVTISFGEKVFSFPQPMTHLPIWGEITANTVNSPAFTLALGGVPKYEYVEMLLGNYPGPMGATNILVLAACLLYLLFRQTIQWQTPAAYFATFIACSWLFPRVGTGLRMQSVVYELLSGTVILGGVFLLSDPVTTPKRSFTKTVFGFLTGIIVVFFRHIGKLEEGFVFAILILNCFVWPLDMLGEEAARIIRRKRYENINGKAIQKKS